MTVETFPIRELVRRTGILASTLRAWEARHGLLEPIRTPSGHRLYSQADVLRVRRLKELLAQGHGLAEAAPLLDLPPQREILSAAEVAPVIAPAWQGYLRETLAALENFDSERLDKLYNEACALYPIDIVTDNLMLPMLEEIGRRWDKRPAGIAEEHFFSAWLRNKLGARLHHTAAMARGPVLVLACLPLESHEIGLLIFALAAIQHGYRVVYLGANMPTRQIFHVVRALSVEAVVLAGREAREANTLEDIGWLVQSQPAPVFVGSHFSLRQEQDLIDAGAYPLGADITQGLRRLEARLALGGIRR